MTAAVRSAILHLTAELWPYARTGGLGQAVADIACEQSREGLNSAVMLPLYRVAREKAGELLPYCGPFTVELAGKTETLRCFEAKANGDGPRTLFLDHPESFDRAGIYGEAGADYPDNDRRFALFALGAIEVAVRMNDPRMIIHAHDWHSALTPTYMRVKYWNRPELHRIATVVTVHNGGFMGTFGFDTMARVGLPGWLWAMEWMEWYGKFNFMKGACLFADMVTTVSPTHARELTTEVGGFGLHHVYQWLHDEGRLVGIRNGIDTKRWDPATDEELTATYSVDDMAGKAKCKAALQRAWGLPVRSRTPVFAMSARMVTQKGLDIIVGSESLRAGDSQFVFLGEGEARLEHALRDAAAAAPDRVALNTQFTDRLEHRLLAGADFLLMPSLYEPCGLTQMRAQRYGAPPIGRTVGGLADTIEDGVTGFLFDGYSPDHFDRAVQRAVSVYEDREDHQRMVREGMRRDFGWRQPIADYASVYRKALARR